MLRRSGAALMQLAVVMVTAASLAFLCLQLAPGDPATALGEGLPIAVREQLRTRYGFDAPIGVQYLRWLQALSVGDFGWSTSQHRPVFDVLADAIPNSLRLVIPAFIVSVLAGTFVGVWQAEHHGTRRDHTASALLLVVYSAPEFWLATWLIILFAGVWPILPPSGISSVWARYLSPLGQVTDALRHMILPVLAIALVGTATLARHQRASMLDALALPFMRSARASGLSRGRLRYVAWRHAVLPVLTMAGVLLPSYLGGLIFIEQIFAWPGLGYTMLRAIAAHDYAVVAAVVIVGSGLTATCTMLVQGTVRVLDPRQRHVMHQGMHHASHALRPPA